MLTTTKRKTTSMTKLVMTIMMAIMMIGRSDNDDYTNDDYTCDADARSHSNISCCCNTCVGEGDVDGDWVQW